VATDNPRVARDDTWKGTWKDFFSGAVVVVVVVLDLLMPMAGAAEALTTAPARGATNDGGGEEAGRVDTGEVYSTVGGGLKPIIIACWTAFPPGKNIFPTPTLKKLKRSEVHLPSPESGQNQSRECYIVAIWWIDVLATRSCKYPHTQTPKIKTQNPNHKDPLLCFSLLEFRGISNCLFWPADFQRDAVLGVPFCLDLSTTFFQDVHLPW
jgi:hypothetical protein